MDSILIIGVATTRNQFVDEWEKSLQMNGYDYRLLGLGEKWEGWITKTNIVIDFLKTVDSEQIVCVCDVNDILFFGNPSEMYQKYMKMSNNGEKILVGVERFCGNNCFKNICNEYINYLNKYPNGGFNIGRAEDISNLYSVMSDVEDINTYDDQIELGKYIYNNCEKIVLDYENDIVLCASQFDVDIIRDINIINNVLYYKNKKPHCLHMTGQESYPLERSEKFRNLLFPDRNRISPSWYSHNLFLKKLRDSKLEIWSFSLLIIAGIIFLAICGYLIYSKFIHT